MRMEIENAAAQRFEQEHIMWADHHDDVQNKVRKTVEGIWYGVWNKGRYTIAKEAQYFKNKFEKLQSIKVPSGRYAVFCTDCGEFAGDELPKLRLQIFECWIADSYYAQSHDYEVEVYYLY